MSGKLRRGQEAASESSGSTKFHKVDFLKIEGDGSYKAVRFLDDPDPVCDDHGSVIDPPPYGLGGWITVSSHAGAVTRPAPADYEGKWPSAMPAVCRNDRNIGKGDCWLCANGKDSYGKDSKQVDRTWTLAVVREEVFSKGVMVGMRDKTVEIEEDGKKVVVPEIVYVNFSWYNFFGNMAALITTIPGQESLLNRDVRITRKGTDKNTDYKPSVYPALPEYDAEGNVIEVGGVPLLLDLRIPEHAAIYKPFIPDLEEAIIERASDDFYAYWFDTSKPQPVRGKKDDKGGSTPAQGQATAPPEQVDNTANEPTQEDLADVQSRIMRYGAAG